MTIAVTPVMCGRYVASYFCVIRLPDAMNSLCKTHNDGLKLQCGAGTGTHSLEEATMIFLIEVLRKLTRLSLGPIIFLIEASRKTTSLSLGSPELQINDFLNRSLQEIDQSAPEPSGVPYQ